MRFKIIYNAYCNRSELNNDITQYTSLPCKDGIDELMELFIVFQMKQELQQLVSFCENPDLIRFATIIIEGREETELLYSHENQPEPQIPEKYKNLVFKAATNDIAFNIKTHIRVEDQQHGDKGVLYNEEFYFHVITSMYSIVKRTINNIAINISADSELLFVLEHIDSIKCLDLQIQETIWANLLRFLSDHKELFQKYYSLCPDEIKEYDSIKKAYIFYLAQQEPQDINLDETVSLAERTNDYGFLTIVFGSRNNDEIKKYLDNRRYLLSKSCDVLFYRIVVINQLSIEEKKSSIIDINYTGPKRILASSIPYDKGWKAFDNGKEVKTYNNWDHFLAIELDDSNDHAVTLKFRPTGFHIGCIISILSLAFVAAYEAALYLKRRRS